MTTQAMPTAAIPDPAAAACSSLLEAFLDGPCEVNAALVSTADGRLVAVARRIEFEPSRIAAISGSLLALSEACARELKRSGCRNAIVESEHGLTIVLRVAPPRGGWTLTTIGARTTSLGLLYTHSKQLAETLAALPVHAAPIHPIDTRKPSNEQDQ